LSVFLGFLFCCAI